MKLTRLKTYWTADYAHAVSSLLDELREAVWETYSAEIIEQRQEQCQQELLSDE